MNMPTNVSALTTTRSLLIAGVLMGSAFSSAWASPPIDHLSHGLEKVGDFFFKIARSLEQGGFADDDESDYSITYDARRRDPIRVEVTPRQSSAAIAPPGYRPSTDIAPYPPRPIRPRTSVPPQEGESFVPPRFQPHPQPQIHPPDVNRQAPREDLSVPLDRQPESSINRSQTVEPRRSPDNARPSGPFEPPQTVPQTTHKQQNTAGRDGKASPPSSSSSELKFATPVPGKHGFVYPPGMEQDPKNMLDVRDFTPGQKVKDPRSGKVFLVP
jgi:hypothetical protein